MSLETACRVERATAAKRQLTGLACARRAATVQYLVTTIRAID